MTRPFASEVDLATRNQTLELLADGVYALTTETAPSVGAIEGEDFLVCFDSQPTPHIARHWLQQLHHHTDKPVRYLVLSHYHATRTLGASAYGTDMTVAHDNTRALIAERGTQEWESAQARAPRLFEHPHTIPGLTWPTITFTDTLTIHLGDGHGELVLAHCGYGHTEGDIIAWLPQHRILFASDLVETATTPYTGDAYHRQWATTTLDHIASFEADILIGGHGHCVVGHQAVNAAIAHTRDFLDTMQTTVATVHHGGGTPHEACAAARQALSDRHRSPALEHHLPFNVARLWDELDGITRPRVWTTERDQRVWRQLQD